MALTPVSIRIIPARPGRVEVYLVGTGGAPIGGIDQPDDAVIPRRVASGAIAIGGTVTVDLLATSRLNGAAVEVQTGPSTWVAAGVTSHVLPTGAIYRADVWASGSSVAERHYFTVPIPSGSTVFEMTDYLTVTPVGVIDSATAAALAGKVNRSGDTMTGPLVLPGDAVADLEAVPKQQLDAAVAGASGFDPNAICVLRIVAEEGSRHVDHGDFWPTATDLGHFFWDAWVAPALMATTGYLVSDGAGGNHALLWGFQVAAGGLMHGTGNVFPAAFPLVTFGSDDGVQPGEWAHHAVSWNGAHIWYYIDGIACGKVPFAGPRQAGYGMLYVGGSDHNLYVGDLAQLRGFEDWCPIVPADAAYGFVPERYFGTRDKALSARAASFLATYMTPGALTVPDLSDGYRGRVHPGVVNAGPYTIVGRSGFTSGAVSSTAQIPGRPTYVVSDTAPFDAPLARVPTGLVPAVPALPAGAKVFDSFNRPKQNLMSITPTLGATDARASLGALTWNSGINTGVAGSYASPWGLINGRAVSLMGAAAFHAAWVVTDAADGDVRVKRRPSATFGTHETGLSLRVVDGANLFAVQTGVAAGGVGSTLVDVIRNVAGTVAYLARFAAPNTGWTTLRATFIGTTLTVYVDDGGAGWTQIGQVTGQTAHQTATGFGLANYIPSTLCRYDDFGVWAA